MKAVQCRMARAALQLGVRELAALARVSTGTITKLERGEALLPRTAEAVQRALEAQGVEFVDNPPGARLRDAESLSVDRSTPPRRGPRAIPALQHQHARATQSSRPAD
jgi:transcriptional regulator with XRE-family HTH domain